MKTKVGNKYVPVVGEDRTTAYFSAGLWGKGESGTYCFWEAISEQKNGHLSIVGRAKKDLPPGERFCRIFKEQKSAPNKDDRAHYRKHAKILKNVVSVMPASAKRVAEWLGSHLDDAQYLERLHISKDRQCSEK